VHRIVETLIEAGLVPKPVAELLEQKGSISGDLLSRHGSVPLPDDESGVEELVRRVEAALEALPLVVLLEPDIEGRDLQVQWTDQGVWPTHWWAPSSLTDKGHLFIQMPAWVDEGFVEKLGGKEMTILDPKQDIRWATVPAKFGVVRIGGALWAQAFLRGEDADKFTI
jgi:hypothetical protein